MSSVSPTGSDYSYYQQQVSDLDDQNAKERKKAEDGEDQRISNLERKYQKELREKDKDADQAISRAKEGWNSALSSERDDNKAEMERLKHDTYDRFGRVNRDNSAEYRQNLDELQNDLDHTKMRDRDNLRATRDAYGEELAQRSRQDEAATNRALNDTRDKMSAQHETSVRNARQNYGNLANESAKRFDDLNRDHLKEMASERRREGTALANANEDYSRRLDRAKEAYEKNTDRQERALRDSLTDHANALRNSHERETNGLRERMGDLIDAERQYEKSGAQGRADAVGELENDWRRRFDTEGESYQRQINDLKNQNDRTESHLSHQNYENMRDRDTFMANTLKAQAEKNHEDLNDLKNGFMRDRAEMDANRKHDNAVRDKQSEDRLAKTTAETQRVLTLQASAMRDSASRQRLSDREELKSAEAALHEQRTSSDTALISPAAEAAMRRQIAGQYEKTSQADQLRNRHETDRVRNEYNQQLTDVLEGDRVKDTRNAREVTSARDEENARFAAHIADLEESKNTSLRAKDDASARQSDQLTKNFTRIMSHQGLESEQQLDAVRDSATSRIEALRDDSAFSRKMAIRESNNKQNKMAHDYEKKLSDQKTTYDDRLADQKSVFDAQAREKERQYRNTLDQQGRAFAHRLSEQDAQFKERERFISETYQDQIDKLRRSNQLLIQRRS